MSVTFDTNVLVYTLSHGDPRHARAAGLLARGTRGECILTLQSLGECFNVLTRKLGLGPVRAKEEIDGFRAAFEVVAAAEEDLDRATAAVIDHGLSFWDAMLWATARRGGCRVLFSEDFQDGRELDGVSFVNPFVDANRRLVDLALPASP